MAAMNSPRFRGRARRYRSLRPMLFRLEDRTLPAAFLVTNTNDSGAGSLRTAIDQANLTAEADVISFDPAVFNVPRTINLAGASGQLNINNSLTVNGPGSSLLTVQRPTGVSNLFRVFNIQRSGYSIDVALTGLTIAGGALSGFGPAGSGAGVFVGNENVTLRDCIVSGNTTAGGDGAGIFVFSYGQLTLVNSTVSGNTITANTNSFGDGGGISGAYCSEIDVVNSTIANNATGGRGGGINLSVGGSLDVANSTISGNTAGLAGGGVYFYGPTIGGGIQIRNSTIAGNSAAAEGGGMAVVPGPVSTAKLAIQNSTIMGNTGRSSGGGTMPAGGGIALVGSAGSFLLESSVVANNSDLGADPAPDIFSMMPVSAAFSLVRNQTGASFPNYATQNNLAAGTDPLFAVAGLANNGGPVRTIALQSASPLIDAGTNAADVGVDARGNGFSRTIGAGPDIGAFEFGAGLPSASGNRPDGTIDNLTANGIAGNALTFDFTVVYTSAAPINLATLGAGDISVVGPNSFNQVATFVGQTTTGNQTQATYRLAAPGGYFDAADYGAYIVVVNPNQVADNTGGLVPSGIAASFRILSPQTFTVTNPNDAGPGSLRQAVIDANNRLDTADTIVFAPDVFSTGTAQTIALSEANGQLDIADPITIVGPGADRLSISGGDITRVMRIQMPGIGSATISGVNLTDGNAAVGSATNRSDGGALWISNEAVTLDGVVVSSSITNAQGGGIGVGNSGNLTIRNSSVTGNTVNAGGPYSSGGGIYFLSGGRLLMENCTISGNASIGHGGGLYLFGNFTDVTIRNTTISDNATTPVAGGAIGAGIALYSVYGPVNLQNCTIAGNSSGNVVPGLGGGGIGIVLGNPSVTAVSTVIAQNTDSSAPDVRGAVNVSNGLVGNSSGATLPNYASQNNLPIGTNPQFVSLAPAPNGGPVRTIALQPTSPLLNAGANPGGIATDARGGGFVRSANGGVDIGAFELQTIRPPKVASAVVNDGSAQRSMVTSITVNFNTDVSFSGNPAAAFSLSRNGGGTVNFTLTLSTQAGATVATLSNFSGGETQNGSLADGRYTLTINAAQVSSFGGALDGNGDGVGGDSYALGDPQGLFRLFGDINADRRIDIADFGLFSSAYGQHFGQPGFVSAFDFSRDGVIDIADFGQFSIRMFTMLP